MAHRLVFALFAALATALGALFLLARPDGQAPDHMDRNAHGRSSTSQPQEPAALNRLAAQSPERSPHGMAMEPDAPRGTQTAPVAVHPEPQTDARLVLHLDVRGPETNDAASVSVRARSDGEPFVTGEPVVAQCPVGATSTVDLSALLEERHAVAALLITAQHPTLRAKRVSVSVDVAHGIDAPASAPVKARLELTPGRSVSGRISNAACPDAKIRVGLWRLQGGLTQGAPVAHADAEVDRTFRLAAPGLGDFLVVAAGGDCQPASRRVRLSEADPEVDVGTLEPAVGEVLAGRVTVAGGSPRYPVSLSLRADDAVHDLGSGWGHPFGSLGGLGLVNGRVIRKGTDMVTAADGTFRFVGLQAGMHELDVHGFDRGHARAPVPGLPVAVPAAGVEIELQLAIIRFALVPPEGEAPAADAVLHLSIEGREDEQIEVVAGKVWGSDSCEFMLEPGAAFQFQLTSEAAAAANHAGVAPGPGELLEVSLAAPPARLTGSLEIRLTGAVPAMGTPFIVHTKRVTPEGPGRGFGGFSGSGASKLVLEEGGVLRAEGVEAGPLYVLAYPGTWAGHRGSDLLDARGEAVVPSGGTGQIELFLERGGRLKIGKRDGSGGWSQVPCIVRDASGTQLDVTFTAYAEDGGGAAASHGLITDLGPSLVFPNPAPGHYTVEVHGESRQVEVRAGETTTVYFD